MAFPEPVAGLVVRYAFLWREEAARGLEEGCKDRPCAVVLVATQTEDGERIVTVLPVTHSPPSDANLAVEIPHATKKRLGLDDDRSWIVVTDANRFVWPGPDLRTVRRGDPSSVAYGLLPAGVFNEVRDKLLAALRARKAGTVQRSE